jgi:acyl-coenzyme A synthetase/AMP-(fatty) acid ligase
MSFRQLQKQVNAFANGLYQVPFKTPAIMVIWGKDTAETLVAQMGAVKAGLNVSEENFEVARLLSDGTMA